MTTLPERPRSRKPFPVDVMMRANGRVSYTIWPVGRSRHGGPASVGISEHRRNDHACHKIVPSGWGVRCNCPDWQIRGECQHTEALWAVRSFFARAEGWPAGDSHPLIDGLLFRLGNVIYFVDPIRLNPALGRKGWRVRKTTRGGDGPEHDVVDCGPGLVCDCADFIGRRRCNHVAAVVIGAAAYSLGRQGSKEVS